MKSITASEANRKFSELLRAVSRGERYTIISRGRPVASITPVSEASGSHTKARAALMARVRKQQPSGVRNWTRDELYER